jgi:hypothetical protein
MIITGITSGADYKCLVSSVNSRIWLARHGTLQLTLTNDALASTATMSAGEVLYPFKGIKQSVTPSSEFVKGTLNPGFMHKVPFHVYDVSSAQKLNLVQMCMGKVNVIVENANSNSVGDSVFEVFGYHVGLEVNTMTRLNRDSETRGSYAIELSTPEDEGSECGLPISLLSTDYSTTLALIEGLETV